MHDAGVRIAAAVIVTCNEVSFGVVQDQIRIELRSRILPHTNDIRFALRELHIEGLPSSLIHVARPTINVNRRIIGIDSVILIEDQFADDLFLDSEFVF